MLGAPDQAAKARHHTVLFYRLYEGFTGGHHKVNDYINHVDSTGWCQSRIFVDPQSVKAHPWLNHPNLVNSYRPDRAGILFIGGTDWRALKNYPEIEERMPVINLIQHVRHALPDTELYSYLRRKAYRICVSREVCDAIVSTGQCNGAVACIPNGIALGDLPKSKQVPEIDVVLAGLKRPRLAKIIESLLAQEGLSTDCLLDYLPRSQYLARISRARVVITLPNESEGFYLPALEAMLAGVALVCPDCIGNRSFCQHGVTCLSPKYEAGSIARSAKRLITQPWLADELKKNAFTAALQYDLRRERADFIHLLGNLP